MTTKTTTTTTTEEEDEEKEKDQSLSLLEFLAFTTEDYCQLADPAAIRAHCNYSSMFLLRINRPWSLGPRVFINNTGNARRNRIYIVGEFQVHVS